MNVKAVAMVLALSCAAAQAQDVLVNEAWVRATVPGQMATGAFMKITAKEGGKLVGVSSPVAGVAEVHEMKMDAGVMKMRALAGGLELPAGKTVELKPGGYHVMLMDLKAQLQKDTTVPLTLVVKNAAGTERRIEMKVTVSSVAPAGHSAMEQSQHKH